jgi:hypothetical protein
MPVYLIESEMPASEMHMWAKYFEARPIGWREDNRTSMLLNAQGVKSSAKEIFPTIAQLSKWEEGAADEDVMRRSLKKSVFGALLEKSVAKV